MILESIYGKQYHVKYPIMRTSPKILGSISTRPREMEWFVTSWLGCWTWPLSESCFSVDLIPRSCLSIPNSGWSTFRQLRILRLLWGEGWGQFYFACSASFSLPLWFLFFLSRMRESYVRVAKHIGHYKWSLKVDFRLRASGYRKQLRSRKPAVWYSLEWYIEEKRQLIGVLCQIYQATKQASNQSKTLFYLEFLDSKGGREYFREYFRG